SGLPLPGPGSIWVIARLALDFRAELHWPDEVEIGTGVIRIGRSSVTLGQGVFLGGRCVASAESVVVVMDQQTRRSAPIPDGLRAALAERVIGG
ncbi:MAG TPA: acyl-CoA thioesterase, partial [Stellaceae bacterium]|nr:acyl-CoA thioesterase [Stellaceae bacterium]